MLDLAKFDYCETDENKNLESGRGKGGYMEVKEFLVIGGS